MRWRTQLKNQHDAHWTDRPAAKLASMITKMQSYFVRTLQRCSANWSVRQWKVIIIIATIVSVTICTYLLIDAMMLSVNKQPVMEVKQMKMPVMIESKQQPVSEEMMRSIQNYKRSMDSMHANIPQGLLDSMKLVERIYHSQK
jgi:hypothetical protein